MNDVADGTAKPEDMREQVKFGKSVQETIDTLTANRFQYATAGDTRRLIEEIGRLRTALRINGLRWGYEHEHVDAVLYPEPEFNR